MKGLLGWCLRSRLWLSLRRRRCLRWLGRWLGRSGRRGAGEVSRGDRRRRRFEERQDLFQFRLRRRRRLRRRGGGLLLLRFRLCRLRLGWFRLCRFCRRRLRRLGFRRFGVWLWRSRYGARVGRQGTRRCQAQAAGWTRLGIRGWAWSRRRSGRRRLRAWWRRWRWRRRGFGSGRRRGLRRFRGWGGFRDREFDGLFGGLDRPERRAPQESQCHHDMQKRRQRRRCRRHVVELRVKGANCVGHGDPLLRADCGGG